MRHHKWLISALLLTACGESPLWAGNQESCRDRGITYYHRAVQGVSHCALDALEADIAAATAEDWGLMTKADWWALMQDETVWVYDTVCLPDHPGCWTGYYQWADGLIALGRDMRAYLHESLHRYDHLTGLYNEADEHARWKDPETHYMDADEQAQSWAVQAWEEQQ
jgi:hypothetical protein